MVKRYEIGKHQLPVSKNGPMVLYIDHASEMTEVLESLRTCKADLWSRMALPEFSPAIRSIDKVLDKYRHYLGEGR